MGFDFYAVVFTFEMTAFFTAAKMYPLCMLKNPFNEQIIVHNSSLHFSPMWAK